MSILEMLDLSTGHITSEDASWLERYVVSKVSLPMRVISHDYGFLVNVNTDELDTDFNNHISSIYSYNFSDAFIKVYRYAYTINCSWINFDQDGELLDNLEHFDW